MSFWRTAMLWPALLAVIQITDTAAQTLPVMGYVAAKNANPKRLEVFKQGLAEWSKVWSGLARTSPERRCTLPN
jgi:putative tryptophan/tyrosine transport system substrate-binding protein